MSDHRPRQPHPWRWMILFSRLFRGMITLGYFKSMGVFLPYIMDSFSANTATAGVISSATLGFGALTTGPFVGALMKVFSARQLSLVGGVLSATGILAVVLSSSITHVAICFGVSSIGIAFVGLCSVQPLMEYFPDNFAFANGASLAGGTVGMMILPPVMEHLISLYGWRNALGLLGAFSFNVCVCGALLRPVKKRQNRLVQEYREDKQASISEVVPGNVNGPERWGSLKAFFRVLNERFDVRLLTQPSFVVFQVVVVFEGMSHSMWHLFLIPLGVEAGFGESSAAFLATSGGLGSLLGRLGHGFFIDRGVIGTFSIFALASLVFAGSTLVNPLAVYSYAALSVVAVVSGIAIGVTYPITYVLMREIVGDQHMSAYGWLFVTHGAGQLIGGLLAGWIHDRTGDYKFVFMAMGVVGVLMAVIATSMRCVRCCSRNQYDRIKP